MALDYQPIDALKVAAGLRIVLLRRFPSPWGQAAKAMMEYKRLDYLAGALEIGQPNAEVLNWSGVDSAPIVAWQSDAPVNKWDDILMLLERLAPERPLIPTDFNARSKFWGLAYAICGELGFGWNRRLDALYNDANNRKNPSKFALKYGFTQENGALAAGRSIEFLAHLSDVMKTQQRRGSPFIIGDHVTAVDFYWAAFSNLAVIQSPAECPLEPEIRIRFENVSAAVKDAVDPILLRHRDRIMNDYFRLPMEL